MANAENVTKHSSAEGTQLNVELPSGFGVTALFVEGSRNGQFEVGRVIVRQPRDPRKGYSDSAIVIPNRYLIEPSESSQSLELQQVFGGVRGIRGPLPPNASFALTEAISAFAGAEGHAYGDALRGIRSCIASPELTKTFYPEEAYRGSTTKDELPTSQSPVDLGYDGTYEIGIGMEAGLPCPPPPQRGL